MKGSNVRNANENRTSDVRWSGVMPMLFLACWLAFVTGCATRTVYLAGDERIYHVQAGQPAPISGWLMSDRVLAELYDALEDELIPGQAPSPPPSVTAKRSEDGSSPNTSSPTEPARGLNDGAD